MKKIIGAYLLILLLGLPFHLLAQTNALSFDGINDYVSINGSTGYNLAPSNHFTIEAWIKTGATGDMAIFSKTDPAQQHRGFEFYMSNGRLMFRWVESATVFTRYQTNGTFNDNNWHHVAISVFPPSGSSGIRFIVDGVQVSSGGVVNNVTNTANGNTILAGIQHGGAMPFNGLIDELRFWSIARSVEQVAQSRGCLLSGNVSGLTLYYRFNQGTAGGSNAAISTSTDEGVNNLTGTLFNFALTGASSNWVDASANGVSNACFVPQILSITPAAAVPGSTVTISGAQFTNTLTNNVVHFGNVRASVTSASLTSLTVTVPPGSGYQPVQVINRLSNFTGFSKEPFLPVFSPGRSSITAADFAAPRNFASGNTPGALETGDLDGDGKADVVVANRGSSTISVFRNTGVGSHIAFAAKADLNPYAPNTNPQDVAIGDIDNDGNPDIVVPNLGLNSISIYRNTSTPGNISFSSPISFTLGLAPIALVINDLNGDGFTDIAFSNLLNNTLIVMRGSSTPGNISFSGSQSFATGSAPRDLVTGDFDGDGKTDLATLNDGSLNISVLRNTSPLAGAFGFSRTDIPVVGTAPARFVVGDFDQNGKPDFAVGQSANSSMSVFANNSTPGNIAFAAKVDFPMPALPTGIAAGDINGDGKVDVMLSSSAGSGLAIFINNGNNSISFATAVFVGSGSSAIGAWLCDVSGDNRPDLLTTAGDLNQLQIIEQILPAPSITAVTPLVGIPASNIIIQGSGFTANDPNAHQIFIGGTKSQASLSLGGTLLFVPAPAKADYKNISVGVNGRTAMFFKPYAHIRPGALPFSANSFRLYDTYEGGSFAEDAVIADFDNDGKDDMVVTDAIGSSCTVFRNIRTGSQPIFATNTINPNGTLVFADAFDMDADGKPDLIGTYISGIGIMKNNSSPGNIAFGTAQLAFIGNYMNVTKAAIADFDADGLPDLVVNSLSSSEVVVMRNVSVGGNFIFTPVFRLPLSGTGGGVAVGDFNSDGRPDIAATSRETGAISIFTNTSAGRIMSFGSPIDIAALSNSRAIVAADFDNDQRTDLAVAHHNSGRITIWTNQTPNNGAISFAYDMELNQHQSGSFRLEVADLNGDAKPDLLVNGSNPVFTLHAYFNASTMGNVHFDPGVKNILNTKPLRAIATGDLDGDNLPDIVTIADVEVNNVQLFLNHINEPFISAISNRDLKAGLEVVIQGSGFTGATGVFFGDWPAHSFVVNNDNQITARVGGGGNGYIKITNATSTFTAFVEDLRVGFDPHVVGSIDPKHAPAGAPVRIFGQNFLPNNTTDNIVHFGNIRAKVLSATASQLLVEAPAGATADQPVSVAIYNRIVQSANRFSPSFSPVATLSPSLFAQRTELALGEQASSLAIADFDGDGKPDIATTQVSTNQVRIQLNTGNLNSFNFSTGLRLATQGSPSQVVAHDMNGDGKTDLAVVNLFGNSISIYRNESTTGNLAFALVEHVATHTNPRAVCFADINKDGRPEMLSVADGANVFSMWRNTGIGNTIAFTNRTDFATGIAPYGIAVAELGGLAGYDVITANRGNGSGSSISVFRNFSTLFNYSFSPRLDIAVSTTGGGFSPAAIDMDNSNATHDDILAPDVLASYIALFPNTSGNNDLSFGARTDVALAYGAANLSIGNLNGDNRMDVATGSFFSSTLALLPNTSSSMTSKTFGARADLIGVANIAGIGIADMNGDGRPDIVTANGNHNTLSIFKNGAPGIVSFSPTNATTGQTITILGNGLQNTTAVSFGDIPAQRFSVISPSEIRAVVGAGQSGNVTVTTAQGTYSIGGFQYVTAGNTLYVHAGVATPGAGQTWATAIPTLSEALIVANLNPGIDSILVAGGIYYPTGLQSLTNRDSALVIGRGNLTLLGGYNAATGNRDIRLNETIISGNIGNTGSKTDNSYHLFVLTHAAVQKVTIDGFTLRDGFAHPAGNFVYNGRNISRNRGSALYSDADIPVEMVRCNITNNETSGVGAIYANHGLLTLVQNLFTNNLSGVGGAIFSVDNNRLFAAANVFFKNSANGEGGGAIYSTKVPQIKDTLVNNVFVENEIIDGTGLRSGGALYLRNGQHHVVNNTFYKNKSLQQGGAVLLNGEGSYAFYNNLFSGNIAPSGADVSTTGSNVVYLQANNSFGNTNPSFTNVGDLDGPDNLWGTLDDGLRIDIGSPALNAGDASKLSASTVLDVSQMPRIMYNGLDAGAYESLQAAIQCPGGTIQYQIINTGQTYGWEINMGSGYQPIVNGGIYSGAGTNLLTLTNVPASMAWANIRGFTVTNGIRQSEPVRTVTFSTIWSGNTSAWNQAANWSCGVPSTSSIAIIPTGQNPSPMVDINGQAGGLLVLPGAGIVVSQETRLEIKK